MNGIVIKGTDGQPVTTSLAIADGVNGEHRAVLQLIRTYQADLEEFGGVAFQMQPFETAGGQQKREVAILNESHATLLLTYMRNSDIVRTFKKSLVRAFFEMRNAMAKPALPDFTNPAVAARAWAEQFEAKLALANQVASLAPKGEFVDRYVESTGLKGFRQVCKLLGANESTFREFLLDQKIMYRLGGEWVPYSDHLDAGRFIVKTGTSENSNHAFNQAKFTPKGVTWIAGEWAKYQLVEQD